MIHICLNNILIKLSEDVSQTMRSKVFYPFVMTKPMVATLDPRRLPQKFSNVDSIGSIYLRMHMSTAKAMLGVNKQDGSQRDMMPLNLILIIEIFDVRRVDFIRPFLKSFKNKYILIVVDYVSKWIRAMPCRSNDSKIIINFF